MAHNIATSLRSTNWQFAALAWSTSTVLQHDLRGREPFTVTVYSCLLVTVSLMHASVPCAAPGDRGTASSCYTAVHEAQGAQCAHCRLQQLCCKLAPLCSLQPHTVQRVMSLFNAHRPCCCHVTCHAPFARMLGMLGMQFREHSCESVTMPMAHPVCMGVAAACCNRGGPWNSVSVHLIFKHYRGGPCNSVLVHLIFKHYRSIAPCSTYCRHHQKRQCRTFMKRTVSTSRLLCCSQPVVLLAVAY